LRAKSGLREGLHRPFCKDQRRREELWPSYGQLWSEPLVPTEDRPEFPVPGHQLVTPGAIALPRRPLSKRQLHHPSHKVFLAAYMPVQGRRLGSQKASNPPHREHLDAIEVGYRDTCDRDPSRGERLRTSSRGSRGSRPVIFGSV